MSVAAAKWLVRAVQEPGDLQDALRAGAQDLTLADLAALSTERGQPVSIEDIRQAFVEDWTLRRALANVRSRPEKV